MWHWMALAESRDKWRALQNSVIKKTAGNFLSSCATISFLDNKLLHGISLNTIFNNDGRRNGE